MPHISDIIKGNTTQTKYDAALQRNRQQVQSVIRNFHSITAQLQKYTTSRLDSIKEGIKLLRVCV